MHACARVRFGRPEYLAPSASTAAAVTEVTWCDAAHGRREQRIVRRIDLNAVDGATLLTAFPSAAQVVRIERVRDDDTSAPRTWAYRLASLTPECTDAKRLGEIVRAHGLIENGSHHIRDVAYGEDRCRTGHLPEVFAVARSVGIATPPSTACPRPPSNAPSPTACTPCRTSLACGSARRSADQRAGRLT